MNYNYYGNQGNDRFLIPFVLGGLSGAALNSVTRPRPVFVSSPYQSYPSYPNYYPQYTPRPYTGGYGYNYNYYY